jgi:hypothetical protein
MEVVVTPTNTSNHALAWSVQNGTGEATISPSSLLSAVAIGNVSVKAISVSNPTIEGVLTISISNQPADSKLH